MGSGQTDFTKPCGNLRQQYKTHPCRAAAATQPHSRLGNSLRRQGGERKEKRRWLNAYAMQCNPEGAAEAEMRRHGSEIVNMGVG